MAETSETIEGNTFSNESGVFYIQRDESPKVKADRLSSFTESLEPFNLEDDTLRLLKKAARRSPGLTSADDLRRASWKELAKFVDGFTPESAIALKEKLGPVDASE